MKKTPSRITKTSSKKGCLCKDGSYHTDCCDGSIWAEGIGIIKGGHVGNKTRTSTSRNKNNSHG